MRAEDFFMQGEDYIVNRKKITQEDLEKNADELIELLRKKSVTYIEAELTFKKAIERLDVQII